jgi:hypothetical protein
MEMSRNLEIPAAFRDTKGNEMGLWEHLAA